MQFGMPIVVCIVVIFFHAQYFIIFVFLVVSLDSQSAIIKFSPTGRLYTEYQLVSQVTPVIGCLHTLFTVWQMCTQCIFTIITIHNIDYLTALMQKVLYSFSDFCFFNMDDVLMQDSTDKDNSKYLNIIPEKPPEIGLKLKVSKSLFSKKHL